MTEHFDDKGIPVIEGDIIRVPHFRAARRKQIYMYKKIYSTETIPVRRVDILIPFLVAVDLLHLGDKPLQDCHSCRLEWIESYEIVDGPNQRDSNGYMICWWERKRRKKIK